MPPGSRPFSRLAPPLLLIFGLLIYYQMGADWMRAEKGRLRSAEDVMTRGKALFWPPWRVLQLYVSHDSDERLYYEFSRLILGEEPDQAFIAGQFMGDTKATMEGLRAQIRPGGRIRLPYRDVSVGYPPVGVLAMLAPRLVAGTLPGYRVAFGAFMGALYLLALAIGWRLARRCGLAWDARRWLWQGAAVLACIGPILVSRFDMVPALLTLCAVYFLAKNRALPAGLFILLGAGAKMYPLLLVPCWLALLYGLGGEARRCAARLLLGFAVLGLCGVGLLALRSGASLPIIGDALLFRSRPFQIESLVGSMVLAARGATAVVGSFGSHNVASPLCSWLAPRWEAMMLSVLLLLAALAGWWASRHRARLATADLAAMGLPAADLTATDLAARQAQALCLFTTTSLLVALCTSKVLSAQYLIWLFPLILILPERAARPASIYRYRLYLVALCLTQIEFPLLYGLLLAASPPIVAVLLARNAVLLYLAVRCLRAAFSAPPRAPAAPAATASPLPAAAA